jgi:hypothetical protein
MAGKVLSVQVGDMGRLIDRPLIDELLARRLDKRHLGQQDAVWCEQHGLDPDALRRVRETVGLSSDPRLAAKSGFQLGVELPEPPKRPEPAGLESELERLEKALVDSDRDYISAYEISSFIRERAAPDEAKWCRENGVADDALERVCDTYGRHPDPEIAAGHAFQLAVEARRESRARNAA